MTILIIALTAAGGCQVDPFELTSAWDGSQTGGDGGMADDGATGDGAAGRDGGGPLDGCIPAPELCDDIDQDCDGDPRNGFDLGRDPANCGECGRRCDLPGAAGTCVEGACTYECLPQSHDLDGDLGMPASNGCEYGPCTVTGAEQCNFIDDDCDGDTDEDVAGLASDPQNCGECFRRCNAINVEAATCMDGICGYSACLDDAGGPEGPDGVPDYADLSELPLGCEYRCPVTPPVAEECNGVDDDCDGGIDELPIAGLGGDCYPEGMQGCTVGVGCLGVCGFGVLECNLGAVTCTGWQGPQPPELCDEIDQDCDGDPRNGFATDSDPMHCGDSCVQCQLPNAVAACVDGQCDVRACLPGWANPDDDDSDGCDYHCTKTGPEVCDGKDNDCDGETDEDLVPPPGATCSDRPPCDGTAPVCQSCNGFTTWRCVYATAGVEIDVCGQAVLQETLCDGIDGDCDGQTDEAFRPQLDSECDDGGIGLCKGTGTWSCDPGDAYALTCEITHPGATSLGYERCNGEDDDCDGEVDELPAQGTPLVDDTVLVPGGTLSDGITEVASFRIDVYEASRPDATTMSPGSDDNLACSNPEVMPWRTVTRPEAEQYCQTAGKRLCTEAEWQRACEGAAYLVYPYGDTFDPQACNGNAYDDDCALPDGDQCLPTGSDYGCPTTVADSCVSSFGVHDLSGNAEEWTSSESPPGSGAYRVRGGSYYSIADGLTCQYAFISLADTVAFEHLGFRCCGNP